MDRGQRVCEDAAGELLDGTRSGTSGTDYHGEIVAKDLVIKTTVSQVSQARQRATH